MSTRQPFAFAVPNPETRREIAQAVEAGIPPEQVAAEIEQTPGVPFGLPQTQRDRWSGPQQSGALSVLGLHGAG